MIARVNDNQYLNILELLWLFFAAEFIIVMDFIKVYDMETDEWHFRRIFWYTLGLFVMTPALLAAGVGIFAAARYIISVWN